MNYYIKQSFIYLLYYVRIQLFLLLMSMPILVWWSIPVSLFAPIGNLIFTPILTIFLLISSLIFFAEVLFISNNFLIECLNWITEFWIKGLSIQVPHQSIRYFPISSLWFLILISIVTVIIFRHKKIDTIRKQVFALILLTAIASIGGLFFKSYNFELELKHNNRKLILKNNNNVLKIEDFGALSNSPSCESFVSFSLIPEIIKQTGSVNIDSIEVDKINSYTCSSLVKICNECHVNQIIIPDQKNFSPATVIKYQKLCKLLESKNIQLRRLSN